MTEVYITSSGVFLPNQPISNEEMEDYLGRINGKDSVAKARILKQNGIKSRYFAIDKNQQSTHS
ncbi:3-oxoacyl-ACP synthase, partial [Marivirga lumbricoides]